MLGRMEFGSASSLVCVAFQHHSHKHGREGPQGNGDNRLTGGRFPDPNETQDRGDEEEVPAPDGSPGWNLETEILRAAFHEPSYERILEHVTGFSRNPVSPPGRTRVPALTESDVGCALEPNEPAATGCCVRIIPAVSRECLGERARPSTSPAANGQLTDVQP